MAGVLSEEDPQAAQGFRTDYIRPTLVSSPLVEALRARPGLLVVLSGLLICMMWTGIASLCFSSPPFPVLQLLLNARSDSPGLDVLPGDRVASALFHGSWWLAGGRITGVYVLASLCYMITFWALYLVGKQVLGRRHSAIAVILTQTLLLLMWPLAVPGAVTLVLPMGALLVLFWTRACLKHQNGAWIAFAIAMLMLLLLDPRQIYLVLTLLAVTWLRPAWRQELTSPQALGSLIIAFALLGPLMAWMTETGMAARMFLPVSPERWPAGLLHVAIAAGAIVLSLIPPALLIWRAKAFEQHSRHYAPTFYRSPMLPRTRRVCQILALVPLMLMMAVGIMAGSLPVVAGFAPFILFLMVLAVSYLPDMLAIHCQRQVMWLWGLLTLLPPVLAGGFALVEPWVPNSGAQLDFPARSIARRIDETWARRHGGSPRVIMGDIHGAAGRVALESRDRPRLVSQPDPRQGAVVIWDIKGADPAMPAHLARYVPQAAPEVPLTIPLTPFSRGPTVRIGYAIIPPAVSP